MYRQACVTLVSCLLNLSSFDLVYKKRQCAPVKYGAWRAAKRWTPFHPGRPGVEKGFLGVFGAESGMEDECTAAGHLRGLLAIRTPPPLRSGGAEDEFHTVLPHGWFI